ncbi:hypothetical protein BA6E_12164 [Bacteroidales bacterium 6E]|nr:hypothetical protein BA6E_12164 [Bacteroidales bacterium 6E]
MISNMKHLWLSITVKAICPQMYPFPEPDISIPVNSIIKYETWLSHKYIPDTTL